MQEAQLPRCEEQHGIRHEDKNGAIHKGAARLGGFREQNERNMLEKRNVARSRVVQSLEVQD